MLRFVPKYIVLSLVLVAAKSAAGLQMRLGTEKARFSFFSLVSAELVTTKDGLQELRMKKVFPVAEDQSFSGLHADFENSVFSSPTQADLVIRKNFVKRENGGSGSYASFESRKHSLFVRLPRYLFTNHEEDAGSFSIAFMIKPYMRGRKMPVLRRTGFFEGAKYGFEVFTENDRIHFEFTNIFTGSKSKSLLVSARDMLSSDEFTPVLFVYDSAQNHVTLYSGGKQQKRVFLTNGAGTLKNGARASFLVYDKSPLVIGDGFTGGIDELMLYNGVLDVQQYRADFGKVESRGERFLQKPAIATSKIIDLKYSNSLVTGLALQANAPQGTRVELLARYSDRKFKEDINAEHFPFRLVSNQEKIFARYLQYQIRMYSDTSGLKTPVVKELRFAVQPDMAPAAPRRLEIVSAKLGEVVLRLMRNSEMDMINGGRYQIYYGVTPDEPLGVIRFKSIKNESGMWQLSTINDKADRLKTSDPRLQNRLQVTITNEMIMQNLVYFREKPQWKMRYPLIRENVNYYFWVTACDQAFDLTPERADHESEPSDAVFARPDLAYSDAN